MDTYHEKCNALKKACTTLSNKIICSEMSYGLFYPRPTDAFVIHIHIDPSSNMRPKELTGLPFKKAKSEKPGVALNVF